MHGLKRAKIGLDRKVLSDLAISRRECVRAGREGGGVATA